MPVIHSADVDERDSSAYTSGESLDDSSSSSDDETPNTSDDEFETDNSDDDGTCQYDSAVWMLYYLMVTWCVFRVDV
jgi:hypothetical protein